MNDEELAEQKAADEWHALYVKGLEQKASQGDIAAKYQLRQESIMERAAQLYDDDGNPRDQP